MPQWRAGGSEGGRNGGSRREERNEGGSCTLGFHWPAVFPLFLHRCRQLYFQVCFTHSGAHTHHTCACTRKYTHWDPGPAHVHTRIRESTHTYTLSDEIGLQRQSEQFWPRSAEESEVTCGCVSMKLESVIANARLMMNITQLLLLS